ncbi:MAG TPA: radical SAM protein [Vicinamibacterales bacterium]|jgi:pyruvate-formate lyase-activating enzyme|nr:radical SAM protein [Vicinamibacterales bacterium]
MTAPRLPTRVDIDAGALTFADGLLLELVSALRQTAAGDLVGLTSAEPRAIETDLDAWCRLTGHAIVARTIEHDRARWVIRHGAVAVAAEDARPVGERLWLYVNFDCNLQCDYCCVRSSPGAARRALGIDAVRRIAAEAPPLGVRAFFVTGGEPFLLPDIDDLMLALAAAAPVTLLTNGMLFRGSRLAALRRLPRERVTLQVSLDSPTADLHDLHRGRGAWQRAVEGIEIARGEGFRVRLAATVVTDEDDRAIREFFDRMRVAPQDCVVRRVALRGFAAAGVAVGRRDLVPEVTITANGVYWHPVGADDEDLIVTQAIFPLADAFHAVRQGLAEERAHRDRLASIFYCA